MAVPDQNPFNVYTANGVTTVFPYEFYLINADDLTVSLDGEAVSTGFTVTGIGNVNGGDVTFLTPPANDVTVMLERVVAPVRLTEYQDNGDLLADTVNLDFDRLWMAIKQSFVSLSVALLRPILGGPFNAKNYRIASLGDPVNDQDAATKKWVQSQDSALRAKTLRVSDVDIIALPNAAQRANKVPAFDSAGNPTIMVPVSGTAADVLIELAKSSGSGLSGFSQEDTYPDDTVGAAIKTIRVAVSSLGLSDTDAEFNATQLNTKLGELFALGVTEIYMDRDYAVDPGYSYTTYTYARRVLHLTDFRFYGPGRFTGLYKTQTEYKLCPPPVAVNNSDIIINKLKKSKIKVVMFGDSISLDWADSLTLGVCQWSIIKAELSAQNPGVTFEFVNRAYGGQTWANANTKPSSFPAWYTDTTRNWVDYIVDENPDIVIMAFGMNDRDSFNMGTMASTITKLKAGLPNAHYVMIPPLVPSRSSSYGNGVGFDGLRFQEGRNFAAGAMRTYALFNSMSVWDLNRYFVQCRDGIDQVACEMQEVPGATPINGAYTADACVDFAFEAKISGWNKGWNKTSPIYINCGGDESEDWVYIGNTGDGKFQIAGRTEYIGTYHSLASTVTIPDADFWLVVTVLNNECHIYIDTNTATAIGDKPASTILITSFRMIRHGGTVRPKIGTGGVITGNVAQIRVMLGQPGHRQKTITDREMWGASDNTAARKLPYGGNGINHPSAQGIARIVTPLLQAQDLKIKFADLSFIVNLSAGLSQFLTPPAARVVGGVLQLKGGITGSAATEGATLATIYGWSVLGMSDFLVSTSGNSGTGWGTRLLRIKSDGSIVAESGSNINGVILNGISIPLV